jgi:hypothetical protein
MAGRIAALAATVFLSKGALCGDITAERVEYLSDLADQVYQHHAFYLAIYHRGLAVTTYCGDYSRGPLFDINWFPVELLEEFETVCAIQCNNNLEKVILRSFIKKKFYGNVDGFIDSMHVQHADDQKEFCDNSQNVMDYLFKIARDRADEMTKMKSAPNKPQ